MTRDEIVIWVRKKTGVPVVRLSSEDSAKQFLKKCKNYAIGLFDNYEVQFVNCRCKFDVTA